MTEAELQGRSLPPQEEQVGSVRSASEQHKQGHVLTLLKFLVHVGNIFTALTIAYLCPTFVPLIVFFLEYIWHSQIDDDRSLNVCRRNREEMLWSL